MAGGISRLIWEGAKSARRRRGGYPPPWIGPKYFTRNPIFLTAATRPYNTNFIHFLIYLCGIMTMCKIFLFLFLGLPCCAMVLMGTKAQYAFGQSFNFIIESVTYFVSHTKVNMILSFGFLTCIGLVSQSF